MLYPNSTPEFRILVKQDGSNELQVRYINMVQGYTSKWAPVQVAKEEPQEAKQ